MISKGSCDTEDWSNDAEIGMSIRDSFQIHNKKNKTKNYLKHCNGSVARCSFAFPG